MTAVLWHIELSHYSEKARWGLDHKRIAHVRRAPLPGLHGPVAMALTRSGHRRLPVLELDGRRIGDSTAILAALEAHEPDPPLYPQDPAERERALALEDFFDEHVGPAVRAYGWSYVVRTPESVNQALGLTGGRARVLKAAAPLVRAIVRADYAAHEEGAERALRAIRAGMDRLEREIASSGYLAGDRFSVADLTAAALFTPIVAPPQRPFIPPKVPEPLLELRAELEAREGGRWIHEMYARHR